MSKLNQIEKQQKLSKIAELLAPVRLDEGEKNTLKSIFSDDVQVYKVLRDLFFGFEITNEEKRIVEGFRLIKGILRKIFIPYLSKDIAIGQNFDLWQTQDIKTCHEDNFETVFEAKQELLSMLEKGFKRIDNPDENEVSLAIEKTLPKITARNNYISYIDSQVRFLMQFVNMDSLTPEERLKMMQANSTK